MVPGVPGAPVYPRRTCMPTLLSDEHNHHHPGSLASCRLIPALALSPPWPAEPAAAWHPGDLAPLAHHHLPRKEQGLARVNEGGRRPGGCLHLFRRLLLPLCHFCKMGHVTVCYMVSATTQQPLYHQSWQVCKRHLSEFAQRDGEVSSGCLNLAAHRVKKQPPAEGLLG